MMNWETEVCGCWVPTHLTEQQKNQCSEVTFADIPWSEKKKQAARLHNSRSFHSSNKTGWNAVKKPNSLKAKKFKVCQYVGILYLYSRMHKESATLNSRLWSTKINANDYCDMLRQLKDAIHRKRPGCLLQCVIPLHNNTTTQHTSYKSSCSHFWKFLDHPPCSLALPHQSIIFNAVRFHATILLKAG
jgi:hypothetical protein